MTTPSSSDASARPSGGRGSRFLSGSEGLFASAEQRSIADALDHGLEAVESGLRAQLHYTDELADAVSRYLFDAGGKRIRPLLTLLTAQWGDGATDDVVRAAQVIELTHLATLYHDDVMDEAIQRRGVTAAQKVWSNSVAILAGDLLFARAGSLGVELGQDAMRRQTETFERLVLGQMRETVGPRPDEDRIEHYLSVLSDKTGSLIALAGEIGISMSNGPGDYIPAIQGFGELIGVAFQVVDDVIDLSANEEVTGKKAGTDVRRGVATLPMLLLEKSAESSASDQELLQALRQGATGELGEAGFSQAIATLRQHEVTEQTMQRARLVADQAIEKLAELPSGVITDALRRFADQVVERQG